MKFDEDIKTLNIFDNGKIMVKEDDRVNHLFTSQGLFYNIPHLCKKFLLQNFLDLSRINCKEKEIDRSIDRSIDR